MKHRSLLFLSLLALIFLAFSNPIEQAAAQEVTATPSEAPLATETPAPTATPAPTETPVPTETLYPSATFTLEPTNTAVPTNTPTQTPTSTPLPSPYITQGSVPELIGVGGGFYQLRYDFFYFASPSSFSYPLPTGMELTSLLHTSTTCNGTWSAPHGGTVFSLTNFTTTTPSGCTVLVLVHHLQPGVYNLPALTVTQGGTPIASSPGGGIVKAFLPPIFAIFVNYTSVTIGSVVEVTYYVRNPNTFDAMTVMMEIDKLDGFSYVSETPTTSCIYSSTDEFRVYGLVIPASANCTLRYQQRADVAGTWAHRESRVYPNYPNWLSITYAQSYPTVVVSVPTATNTPTPSNTPTNTPTPTETLTPSPTSTPTDTPTSTNTPTETAIPTSTYTPTATDTPTETPTSTPTPSNTPTETPTNTPTATNTPTPIGPLTATTKFTIALFSGPGNGSCYSNIGGLGDGESVTLLGRALRLCPAVPTDLFVLCAPRQWSGRLGLWA